MFKKMLIAGACMMAFLLLVGCQADKKPADDKATESASATTSFSESNKSIADDTEEATEEVINDVKSEDTEIVDNKAEVEENCGIKSDNVEKDKTVTPQATKSTESTGQSGNTSQSESKAEPADTQQPATSKNTENDTPKPTAPSTDVTEAPKPTEEPKTTEEAKPSIDIDGQISFAKEYAASIGLMLDSTATDCWDNPITVNASKADVKGDIKSRLNRYKNTEGFTSVWVWAVKISDMEYELYIGYA